MYREEIEAPVRIGSAEFMHQAEDSNARVALAAYLLIAGPLFVDGVAGDEGSYIIPPPEDLREAAINVIVRRIDSFRSPVHEFDDRVAAPSPSSLAELVTEANRTGDPYRAARAVAMGLKSEDELIRVCALVSAVEFFDLDSVDVPGQIDWLLRNSRQSLTLEILSALLARIWAPPVGSPSVPGGPTSRRSRVTGLMTVHGTVLPYKRSNRPEWSVPTTGPLFQHLANIRPDIYGNPDYYRWEGGYTDYAREVAIQNLFDWIDRRRLSGIDVVAHSHGCNVVLGSAMKGTKHGKLVLMNCPVHWGKYRLPTGAAGQVISVRIRFDLVIAADRGGQRFPPRTIQDRVLPFWYTAHSACTKPQTWVNQKLDGLLQ